MFNFLFFIMYMSFSCTHHGWCLWRWEEVLDFLVLELQAFVSLYTGAGNWTVSLEEQSVLLTTESSLQH